MSTPPPNQVFYIYNLPEYWLRLATAIKDYSYYVMFKLEFKQISNIAIGCKQFQPQSIYEFQDSSYQQWTIEYLYSSRKRQIAKKWKKIIVNGSYVTNLYHTILLRFI